MLLKSRPLGAALAALLLLAPLRKPRAASVEDEIPSLPVLPALSAPQSPAGLTLPAPAQTAPGLPALTLAAAPGAPALPPLASVQERLAARPEGARQTLDQAFDRSITPADATPPPEASPAPAAPQPDWTQGVFLPRTIDAPLRGDALGVTVHRLANGLTVYLSPNKQEPRISYVIAVRAGSRHDPLEATGMAHYLEHMQFKGTQRLGTVDFAQEKPHLDRIQALYDTLFVTQDPEQRRKIYAEIDAESQLAARYAVPNETDKLYASEGMTDVNAHTFYNETTYSGSLPSNKTEVWARVEADRLTDPVYRIFLPELETVYEEYNRSLDAPNEGFMGAGLRAIYQGHPYARDVIGLGEHLKNPSISRMRRFFSDYYRPNNMAIALSGDFDRQKMLALIETAFGRLAPAKLPPLPAGKVQRIHGVQRSEVRFEAEEAVQIAWQLPGRNDPDEDALTLADQVLINVLNDRVGTAQKAKQAGALMQLLPEAGGWLALAVPKEGQTLEQAEQVLMEEIARFKAGDFSDDDVRTAVTQLEVKKKMALQDNEDRAEAIGDTFIGGEEWAHAAGAMLRLKRLTKADVLRVANRYLGEDRAVVYRRKGLPVAEKVAKPVFTDVPIDTSKQSAFFKELAALPTPPTEPHFLRQGRDYRTLDRPWGRLYWTRNPVTDLFELEFRFERGAAQDRKLDLALELLEVAGAGDLTAEQFHRKLASLGSTMRFECGERNCSVKLSGLEANLEETVRLALLRFSAPNVAPGAFARMIDIERGDRADRKLDPEAIEKALAQFAARGKDSPFLKELAPAELDALTEKDLKATLASFFDYRRGVLYTGRARPDELAQMLSRVQRRRYYKAPPRRQPVKLLRPSRPRVIFVHHAGMKQAVIGAYAADGPFDPNARADYRLYNMAMGGGMGGIYFQEIRESRALAYETNGGYKPASHPGDDNQLVAYAGTQADKAVKTATLMAELMSRPPVTPERFAIAKTQAEESLRSEVPQLGEIPRKVLSWERLGLARDPGPVSLAKVRAYSPARLAKFTARFKDKPLTLYVVGDRNSVDLEGLKKLGDFEERGVDELFPY